MRAWLLTFNVTIATAFVLMNLVGIGILSSNIQGYLQVDYTSIFWIGKIFLLMVALTVPIGVKWARAWGYKRTFMLGIILSFIGAASCFVSEDYGLMLVGRAIGGVGGGIIMTLSVTVLARSLTEPTRSRAIEIYSTLSFGLGIGLGMLLGGYVGQSNHWRVIFVADMLLLGLLALITWFVHPETERVKTRPFDWIGYLSLALFFTSLLLLITQAKAPWNTLGFLSSLSLSYITVSLISLAVYLIHTPRTKNPLFDLALFKEPLFTAGCLGLVVVGIMVFGVILVSIRLLENSFQYEKLRIGYLLSTIGFTYVIVGFIPHIRPRLFIIPGLALIAFSCFLSQQITIQSDQMQLITIFGIRAAGVALAVGPLTSLSLAHFSPEQAHEGARIILFARSMAGAFGSGIVGLIAKYREPFHAMRFGEMVNQQSARYQQYFAELTTHISPHEAKLQIINWINRQAELAAVIDAIYILGWAVGGIILIISGLLIREHFRKKSAKVIHKVYL